jgi:hypothetical protein
LRKQQKAALGMTPDGSSTRQVAGATAPAQAGPTWLTKSKLSTYYSAFAANCLKLLVGRCVSCEEATMVHTAIFIALVAVAIGLIYEIHGSKKPKKPG